MKKDIRQQFISYFENASTCGPCEKTGLELEHFVVDAEDRSVSYYGPGGVEQLLLTLKDHFPQQQYADGNLIGLSAENYTITIEPAAQLEISIAPQKDLNRILSVYSEFRDLLAPHLAAAGEHLETWGYHPVTGIDELPLIPKTRYEYMDRYFRKSGAMGANMMRGTASTQISIDYRNEADFVREYRFAYLLMPALKLICSNIPVFEGKKNTNPLQRTVIWRNTDRRRCDPPADVFADSFGFASYADYLMQVPLILLPADDKIYYVGKQNCIQLFADRPFTRKDAEHVMSMVFPDVRLKSYLELRGADSLPVECAVGYAALIKGLFYADGLADSYLKRFRIGFEEIRQGEDNLMQYGKAGELYGMPVKSFAERLFSDAAQSLPAEEQEYLLALQWFWKQNRYL